MNALFYIILIHQFLFQGMFFSKNIYLKRKMGEPIKGKNREAVISIIFFILFIALSFLFSFSEISIGGGTALDPFYTIPISLCILGGNLAVAAASLLHMKDSWRVGVLENQITSLVESGIYRYSRNPYFLSYIMMFIAYTILLQNVVLLGLSIIGVVLIHLMILKEESYLLHLHSEVYLAYKKRVPRYLFI